MRWMSAFRAYAKCISRGAYAPRSCVAVRTSAGETTIFAMHKRTFNQERRASARRGALPIRDIASCPRSAYADRSSLSNAPPSQKRHSRIHMRFSTKSGVSQPAVVRFPSATSEIAIPERTSCSANRHRGDVATTLLTLLVAAYLRLFSVAGIEGPAERPKQALKECRQPTRRRTCRMSLHVYLGAR
jgi:hypothetical protein